MALIFADGFDNYANILDFWDQDNNAIIDTTPGHARTGVGCASIPAGAFGCFKAFGHMTHILACTAWDCSSTGYCFFFYSDTSVCVQVLVNADGSITFETAPSQGDFMYTTVGTGLVH